MKIALLGTVGVPGRYGGFETLAENLVRHHSRIGRPAELTVWCSAKDNASHPPSFDGAELRYVGLRANGVQSIPYDALSLWQAVRSGHDCIILLGISGALALPLIRLVARRTKIVTNIDGIEWKRRKWNWLARLVLRASEGAAVRYSHDVIADNQAIADYVRDFYGSKCHVIAYGGDHAVAKVGQSKVIDDLPWSYALALCRIEPENNVDMILEAYSEIEAPLVVVGNWSNSSYGRALKSRFGDRSNLHLLDPIYEPHDLYAVRFRASIYLHGHSAGGTNPALVEMMHFGIPVLAFDCDFNRFTTEERAIYFKSSADLREKLEEEIDPRIGADMLEIAQRRYCWDQIGEQYFAILRGDGADPVRATGKA